MTALDRHTVRFAVANLKECGFVKEEDMLLEAVLGVPSLKEIGVSIE